MYSYQEKGSRSEALHSISSLAVRFRAGAVLFYQPLKGHRVNMLRQITRVATHTRTQFSFVEDVLCASMPLWPKVPSLFQLELVCDGRNPILSSRRTGPSSSLVQHLVSVCCGCAVPELYSCIPTNLFHQLEGRQERHRKIYLEDAAASTMPTHPARLYISHGVEFTRNIFDVVGNVDKNNAHRIVFITLFHQSDG